MQIRVLGLLAQRNGALASLEPQRRTALDFALEACKKCPALIEPY